MVGFGMEIRYNVDDVDENEEMRQERLQLESLIKDLSMNVLESKCWKKSCVQLRNVEMVILR